MKRLKKTVAMLTAVATMSTMLFGSGAVVNASEEETILRIGVDGDITDISPYGTMSAGRGYVFRYIYEYMAQRVEYGASLDEMELICAKSITEVDDLTYDIEMYDYIEDAAGNHITAEDYVWSANMMKEAGNYEKVNSYLESVEAIGEYEVEMVLTEASLGAVEYLLSYIPVISQTAYENSDDSMMMNPISTATYQVESYTSGSSLVLVKNENYWQTDESLRYSWAEQNVDRVEFSIITEAAQMTIALETGTIDVAERISSSELPYFYNDGEVTEGYLVSESAASTVNSIIFNCSEDNPLSDERVRQAICYAINSDDVMTAAVNGLGFSLNAFASPLASDYVSSWDENDYYSYNVETAQELLEEAGYSSGDLTLTLMLENDDTILKACQVIQAELASVGINLELLSVESALFSSYESDPDQWDIIYVKAGCDDYCSFTWTLTFNANSFTWDGCLGFIVDDELQSRYDAAANIDTHSEETVDAFQTYLTDNAYGYALFGQYRYIVANADTVSSLVVRDGGELVPGCCVMQ
ncbi:MAG: ABC transporter substrate-binding protein [Clostridiales bacterium]|nr:ABC transporter substrate-binding protein [Clostridiales bacterium]